MYFHPYTYPQLADDSYLIIGLFEGHFNLTALLSDLEREGTQEKDVSVVMSDDTRKNGFIIDKGSKMGEMAAGVGAFTGLVGALVLGIGNAVATAATGGLNLVVAGPLISSLAGFGGGAAVGGALGAFVGAGMPEYELEFTRKHLENGHVLVAVKGSDKEAISRVSDIFARHNAVDAEARLEQEAVVDGKTQND